MTAGSPAASPSHTPTAPTRRNASSARRRSRPANSRRAGSPSGAGCPVARAEYRPAPPARRRGAGRWRRSPSSWADNATTAIVTGRRCRVGGQGRRGAAQRIGAVTTIRPARQRDAPRAPDPGASPAPRRDRPGWSPPARGRTGAGTRSREVERDRVRADRGDGDQPHQHRRTAEQPALHQPAGTIGRPSRMMSRPRDASDRHQRPNSRKRRRRRSREDRRVAEHRHREDDSRSASAERSTPSAEARHCQTPAPSWRGSDQQRRPVTTNVQPGRPSAAAVGRMTPAPIAGVGAWEDVGGRCRHARDDGGSCPASRSSGSPCHRISMTGTQPTSRRPTAPCGSAAHLAHRRRARPSSAAISGAAAPVSPMGVNQQVEQEHAQRRRGEIDRPEPGDEYHIDRDDRHLEQVRPDQRPASRTSAAAVPRRSRARGRRAVWLGRGAWRRA